ncbi:hypothetical protein CRG98_007024 [Punica granatum]|uniref:Retrotransposon Copia-like N-terminal domain-containing protein n=1 Tax=Punica granatum TaxID=22663 RepID=A0A2I0KW00_PUNGR|nr:hypothetical protein CRG98_007024 [Punica granatum]
MEKGKETSGKGSIEAVGVNQTSVFAVNSSDYTGVNLIKYKLNGSNYLTWSRAMMTALTANNKVGMANGSVPRPPEGDPNLARWDMCNAAHYLSYSSVSNRYLAYVSALDSKVEPTSYRDAAANPRWKQAMVEEIKALESNGTWTIESLPLEKRLIDCK